MEGDWVPVQVGSQGKVKTNRQQQSAANDPATTPAATAAATTQQGPNTATFPYHGEFSGVGFNCQSLYAYEKLDTLKYVAEIAGNHDFNGLSETRETSERKAAHEKYFQNGFQYFSN